jgi:hypothetical protein
MKDKKKVCIFTNFFNFDEAYSLIRVTEDQIKMLTMHGYKPVVIVSESFEPKGAFAHKDVELRKVPNVPCHNEVKKDKTFDEDVNGIAKALKKHLKDIDVCITQDIVYKPSELKYNFAARRIAKDFPKIRWLHWINSATPPITLNSLMGMFTDEYLNLMKIPFPNSYYVFFNKISEGVIAKNFNVSQDQVRTVHHPSDLDEVYGVEDKNLKNFIKKRNIYDADAICLYPIRLDRGKQVEYPIKTMAKLKELGMSVRMIVVDFHSTGGDKVTYRDELKAMGIDWGLTPQELSFTSEFCEEWRGSVPHKVVLALFRMSNVFVMSSVSESYSYITQEAALTKNVIVLNQDFPPFRDIFGPAAIHRKYSSNWDLLAGFDEAVGEGKHSKTGYGPASISDDERVTYEGMYHKDTAGMIANRLRNDPAMAMQIRTRRLRSLEYVFKNELEPLLYG